MAGFSADATAPLSSPLTFPWPPLPPPSLSNRSPTFLCSNSSYASRTVTAFLWRRRVFLALWRLLSASYVMTNSVLVMWLTCDLIKSSSALPYARFKGLKHPTSSGWRRCDEWAGRQRVIILLSLQNMSNAGDLWLSWPSNTNMR